MSLGMLRVGRHKRERIRLGRGRASMGLRGCKFWEGGDGEARIPDPTHGGRRRGGGWGASGGRWFGRGCWRGRMRGAGMGTEERLESLGLAGPEVGPGGCGKWRRPTWSAPGGKNRLFGCSNGYRIFPPRNSRSRLGPTGQWRPCGQGPGQGWRRSGEPGDG